MKSILDPIRRHTGLSHTESIAVAGITLLLLAGWVGRSLTEPPSTHQVETAERVIALLDSLIAQTAPTEQQMKQRAASTEQRGEHRAASTEQRGEHRAASTEQRKKQRAASTKRRVTLTHKLDINTASSKQLEALPGIGPSTARKIIVERGHSPFQTVDDLLRVRGIGPAKLEKVRPYVRAP